MTTHSAPERGAIAFSDMPRIRRIALGCWAILMAAAGVFYTVRPELLQPDVLVEVLRQSGQPILWAYIVLNVVRAFTLIPSTALIVAGTLLFPDRPGFVIASSLAGSVVSAWIIFRFFEFLGLGDLISRRHASRLQWLECQVRRKGFWIVAGWAVLPFTPTDLICYVAGTLRMPVGRFLAAILLGKLPLVTFYVGAGTLLFGP